MLRLLRKNEKLAKWTLVIGMTLLLISWLVADGSTQLVRFMALSGTTWATVDGGKKVTLGDLEEIQKEMRLLDVLKDQYIETLGASKDPAQWYLLSREAEQAGLTGGMGEGLRAAAAIGAAQKVSEAQVIGVLAGQSGLSGNETLLTLAKVAGVKRLINLTSGSPPISDNRLKQRAAELLLAVGGSAVFIDSHSAASISIPIADEARLETHLKEHGEKSPPTDGKGFGYRLADRVQIEWLEVSAASVRSGIETSGALSEIAMRKYWHEHPEQFATSTLGAQSPTYEAMHDSVRTKLLDSLVAARMSEISKFASDKLQMAVRGIPQQSGVLVLPPDWDARSVSFAQMASEISQKFGVPAATPAAVTDRWMLPSEIDKIEGLGTATTDKFGRTPVNASKLAAASREFAGDSAIPSQARVAAPVLFNSASGSLFLFRVTATDKSRAPASLSEVRDAVLADVSAIDRFAALTADTERMKALGVDQGMETLASAYGSKVDQATELREADPRLLSYGLSIASPIPGVGSDAEVLKRIVRAAMALPPETPVGQLPLTDRTLAIEVPSKMGILVFQINSVTPMTREEYARLAPSGGLSAASEQSAMESVDPRAAYTFDALAARHGFVLTRENSSKDADPAADATPPAN
ncbi:MAG: hypothetical protein EXS00_01045 [Phycisphaerales bacterium]|nr:hypothetical protein [Phycisphaerales bacterium]